MTPKRFQIATGTLSPKLPDIRGGMMNQRQIEALKEARDHFGRKACLDYVKAMRSGDLRMMKEAEIARAAFDLVFRALDTVGGNEQ